VQCYVTRRSQNNRPPSKLQKLECAFR
jgi:hypothetical protein